MNKAITVEIQFFLISILWGVILLFVYDVLRILRRVIKHNGFFIAIEDLLFWVLSSLFIFIMMYQQNDGILRGFAVMGMFIGMVLYHYILSEIFVKLTLKLIHLLLSPIVFIINWVKKILKFVYSKGKKIASALLLRLKKIAKSVKIALSKKQQKRALKLEKIRTKRQEEKKLSDDKKFALKEAKKKNKAVKKKQANKKQIGKKQAKEKQMKEKPAKE